MSKVVDVVARVVLVVVATLFMMYPVAAVTGWHYHLDIGFTLWRKP